MIYQYYLLSLLDLMTHTIPSCSFLSNTLNLPTIVTFFQGIVTRSHVIWTLGKVFNTGDSESPPYRHLSGWSGQKVLPIYVGDYMRRPKG